MILALVLKVFGTLAGVLSSVALILAMVKWLPIIFPNPSAKMSEVEFRRRLVLGMAYALFCVYLGGLHSFLNLIVTN